MICAETFGCSGKLSFNETREFARLNETGTIGNFSRLNSSQYVLSIDRVSRCALNWGDFAEIAFSHVIRDIEVGLARPIHATVCFEFGCDADEEERAAFVKAVHSVAARRGIAMGKCHSAMTNADVTSLVVTMIGEIVIESREFTSHGGVWLSGPLGRAKLLYFESIKENFAGSEILSGMCESLDLTSLARFSVVSDVSGHGLVGCLYDLADRLNVQIDVTVSDETAASIDVVTRHATLLENSYEDFPQSSIRIAEKALTLALGKETAGPVIGLSGDLEPHEIADLTQRGWRRIGSFSPGDALVSIGWRG